MNKQRPVKMTAEALSALGVVALATGFGIPSSVQAQESLSSAEQARIKIGFEIAPVPLNLERRDVGPDIIARNLAPAEAPGPRCSVAFHGSHM